MYSYPGGSWNYNYYGNTSVGEQFSDPTGTSTIPINRPTIPDPIKTPLVVDHQLIYKALTVKVLSPSNKRDFTVHTLRDVKSETVKTPDDFREVIVSQIGDSVSKKTTFPIGYFKKSEKVWINNEKDFQDALRMRWT